MFRNCCLGSAVVAVCLVLCMALPAAAQKGYQWQGQPGESESQPQISNAELEKAAEAYAEIRKINQGFQQSLQEAKDSSERQKLQEQANKDVVQAVEDTGLEVQKYNSIMRQIGENEELRKEFSEKVETR
ncbi:MAG: DUF4168 domain-containing protein [Syntrophobacteria bacterium]